MGLWVRAIGPLTLTEPHERTDHCWDEHRVAHIIDPSMAQSARGLELDRCYVEAEGARTVEVLSLSYMGYNRWRGDLCRAVLDCDPEQVWSDLDGYRGRPFFELIHFADNEGTIGPEAAADLLADFELALADGLRERFAALLPDGWPEPHRAHYVACLDRWVEGLRVAADRGLVMFG